MANRIITFWGSPGAGTTTIALKTAAKLADEGLNVIVILADDSTFPIGLAVQNYDKSKSIGHLLNANIMDDQMIPFSTIVQNIQDTKNPRIGLLGYMLKETKENYVAYDSNIANSLFNRLISNPNIDCLVIDGSTNLIGSVITQVAIARADRLFYVASPNIKSIAYLDSYMDTAMALSQSIYQEVILNAVMDHDPVHDLSKLLKNVKYTIPFSANMRYQMIERDILTPLKSISKIEKKVDAALKLIHKTIMEGDED